MNTPFLDALDERALVCDGAMGTMLYARGIFLNRSFDELNLTQPDLVAEVHQAYVRAGAELIETNTFGANRVKLAAFGLVEQLHTINAQGARIARRAARDEAYVGGAIGPLGIRVEPWGKTGFDEAEAWFGEQAAALLEGGVDLFILETFRDLNELHAAIRAVRSVSGLPIVAQVTTEDDGNSLDGTPPETFAPQIEGFGADVVGVNCSVGPAAMLETLERIASVSQARLSAQPNAGRPRDVEGRNIYLCSPEYMASYARRFVLNGVKLVGGCCGTAPRSHSPDPSRREVRVAGHGRALAAPPRRRAGGAAQRAARAAAREISARQRPGAWRLGSHRVGHPAKGAPGGRPHRAGARAEDPWRRRAAGDRCEDRHPDERPLPAVLVEQQTGLETLLNYTCRDHRLLGMQSDLLGAHAMGLRNLLITTGDPQRLGEFQDATLVFDVDSIGLTNVVSRLNHGSDIGGQPVVPPTAFHVGVAVNPSALNLDEELRRFHYKVEAGAEFVVTHPVFDPADLEVFLQRIGRVTLPIIASVRPLDGERQAEALANEVPGVRVPTAYVARLAAAEAAGHGVEEGIAIARDIVARLRPLVQGIQVAVPPSRLFSAVEVLSALDS